ncbi:MAG TPA: hypothetical protein VN496_07615 [Burkholderiales bacterium]|nr:hypothetical protein [Burkholderiales bacterium]
MDRRALLEQSIMVLAQRAGVDRPVFHVISVSQDSAGIFLMQTRWPDGQAIYEAIARDVDAFPKDHYTTCVALLPEVVDQIIRAAREERPAVASVLAEERL